MRLITFLTIEKSKLNIHSDPALAILAMLLMQYVNFFETFFKLNQNILRLWWLPPKKNPTMLSTICSRSVFFWVVSSTIVCLTKLNKVILKDIANQLQPNWTICSLAKQVGVSHLNGVGTDAEEVVNHRLPGCLLLLLLPPTSAPARGLYYFQKLSFL